jgi:hypothetical protein
MADREVFIDIDADVRIRYRRTEQQPPARYAITLETRVGGSWETVRLWDNADAVDEHHDHEYTREGGKQPPQVKEFGSVNEAMAAAILTARTEWRAMLSRWEGAS